MKKFIIITAFTNDADYITNKIEIDDKKLEMIMPMIEAIKNFKPYQGTSKSGLTWKHQSNYPCYDACRKDLGEKSAEDLYGHIPNFEMFDDMVPKGEHGCHSIDDIEYLEVTEHKSLLT